MEGSAGLPKSAKGRDCWRGFEPGSWRTSIDVRDFIIRNVTPYEGDEKFLVGPTKRTEAVWKKLQPYFKDEQKKGVLAVDAKTPSTLLAHKAGYIDRDNEIVVGLQTDQPFKRAIFPAGGLRMVEAGLKAAGFEADPQVHDAFTKYRKTHNDGVFDAYTPEIMKSRKSGIITGLPDAYGRGRIIGDYRRVALYGVERLIEEKHRERAQVDDMWPTDEVIRTREELAEQVRALEDLVAMAKLYDCDVARPAADAHEAVQWTYLAYLGAVKEANGAAMSIGRISSFLDVYIERDLREGTLDEAGAQELWDQLVQKLRIVRFLRTPDYDALFSGDPYWATECVGGMDLDGRPLVTKSSYRMLHTLTNLGPAPEPNITVLWSKHMPDNFKRYCVKVSRDTSSLQYENDDLMRPSWGDDYGIACCVSAMKLGRQMQFFGARVNLAKALLYAINGGQVRGGSSGQNRPEVFSFATRLTRLTPALAASSPDTMLAKAGEAAPDWSGGTRIGAAVKEFNDHYGSRGMARGAVVLIISDGWETGEPELLGAQMARLSRVAHRIVWANPRTQSPRYRPEVGGMAAAWPYCDAVVSAHNLDALDDLLIALRAR